MKCRSSWSRGSVPNSHARGQRFEPRRRQYFKLLLDPGDFHSIPSRLLSFNKSESVLWTLAKKLYYIIIIIIIITLQSPYRQMLCSGAAGAMGGAVAKTSIAPLDRTKIYFQTHPERNYRIKGAIKFLKLTYKQDGILSLWRGNSATMLRYHSYIT